MKHFFAPDQVLFVENPIYKTFASHAVSDKLVRVFYPVLQIAMPQKLIREVGIEFAKKLLGRQTLLFGVSMTSPCSLNRSTTFCKTGQIGGTLWN